MNAPKEGIFVVTFNGRLQEEYRERGGRLRLNDAGGSPGKNTGTCFLTEDEACRAIGREIVAGGGFVAREGFRVYALSLCRECD